MAITAPTPIAALPAAPDPNDRATFNARAYPWAAAQAAMVTETNAIAENVFNNATEAASLATTASSQVALASAAANYKGLWSSLSGALNMPASVSHNGNYWALNANLANVTTATPGVSGSWQALNVGAGGATETSSAVDVTLTAASYRVQAVAMTATDKSVNLPSATTLQVGGALFVVKNTGTIAFAVRNNAGTLLTAVDAGQIALLYLSNASTSAGVWHVGLDGANALAQTIYQATALNVNAVSSTHVSVTAMSATQAIAAWAGASGYLNCCTLNISGNVITSGSVLTVNAVASTYISVAAVSATQAVVTYAGTTSYIQACTLNVSGTTITAGAVLNVNAVASIFSAVAAMSATQAIVTYSGTSSYTQACTLNISGTTLTAGAVLSVNAINSSYQAITPLSATQAVIAYSSTSAFLQACTLNVSGTTLTAGAILTLNAAESRFPSLAAVSATQAVISYTGPTAMFPLNARALNISGTTITAGGILVQPVTPVQSVFSSLKKLTANKFVFLSSVDGIGTGSTYGSRAQVLGLNDSQLTAGVAVTLKGGAGSYGALAAMSETKAIAVYLESSGYIQTRVLEIGV